MNNFDLIRLVLAGMVALVHVALLTGEPALAWIPTVVSSDLAVKAFFVVSGFLIVMSYERAPDWRAYAERRVRRIYPGYAVVILGAAVSLWFVSTEPLASYFSSTWLRHVVANLAFLNFLQPTLPGVFGANLQPTVNGALWTLKVEVAFYAIVPALIWACRRFGWRPVLSGVYLLSFLYLLVLARLAAERPALDPWTHQLPAQMTYFAAGAAFYYGWPKVARHLTGIGLVAVAVVALSRFAPPLMLALVEPAALAAVVISAAFVGYLGPAGRFGDFSYGLYILHFPVIQWLVGTGWFAGRPLAIVVIALGTALGGAVLLWHLVEKRWLLDSSHYRRDAARR